MTRHKLTDAIAETDHDTTMWKARFAAAKGAYEMGEFRQAETLLYRALEQAKSLKESTFAIHTCHVGLGAVYLTTGKLNLAQEHLHQVITALSASGDRVLRELCALARRFCGEALADSGNHTDAEEQLKTSVQMLAQLGDECALPLAYVQSDLACLYITMDRLKEARELVFSAMELLERTVGSEDPECARAHLIYNICDSKEEELLSSVEDGIFRLQYQFDRKHPNITKALRWYLKRLQERGETDKIEEVKNRFDLHFKTPQVKPC